MTIMLLVCGDGDYEAMYFEDNFEPQAVYAEMVREGATEKTLVYDTGHGYDVDIYVSIHHFGEIDSDFISFLFDNYFLEYDALKGRNFFEVDEVIL